MFLNIRDMEVRKVVFETTFPPGEIEFFDRKLWQAGSLRTEGSAELMGATQEIRVKGRLAVTMESECDRCLEPARFPLETSFDLFYRPTLKGAPDEEMALDEGEIEMGFYEGEGLDLKDILREQVLLALPMQRICREDCKGICPQCGQNRNTADCGCRPHPEDDRWSALKKII